MCVNKITKFETNCLHCNTKVTIEESNFRTIASQGINCPVCTEYIQNVNFVIEDIYNFNKTIDDLNSLEEKIKSYPNCHAL